MSDSIRPALYSGAFWLALGSGGQKLLGLIARVILARLLFPEDFGVFAMAAFSYELAAVFSGLGTSQYVVSARNDDFNPDAAFRVNLGFALLLGGLLALTAPWAARFFNEPSLGRFIPVLALSLPLGALGAVNGSLLLRDLRMDAVEQRRFVVEGISVGLMITLAVSGAGVWSLIVPVPVRNLATTVLNLRLHPWRPTRHPAALGTVLRYGAHIMSARLAKFLGDQLDNAAVGRVLGKDALGFYDFGYQAATMPARWAGDIANRLAFPALAHRARHPLAAKDPTPYLRISRWMVFIAAPMVGGLGVVAHDWVSVIYGMKWISVVPIIRIFCPAVFLFLVAQPALVWMQATGHEQWPARLRIAALPLFALGLWVSVPHGIVVVAYAMSGVLALLSIAMVITALRCGAAPPTRWLGAVCRGALPSAIMFLVLLPLVVRFANTGAPVVRLLLTVSAGVVIVAGASLLVARQELRDVLALVRHGLRRKPS